jgi:hypothetical protein
MKNGSFWRRPNGISYIYIPYGVDRDAFVYNCLNTGTVYIINEEGEAIRDVKIGFFALQLVEFPKNAGDKGSMVSWINIDQYSKPVIVDVYTQNDETFGLLENEFEIKQEYEGNSASVGGNAESGDIAIAVNNVNGADIDIKANGGTNSKVSVKSTGSIDVESDEDMSLSTNKDINLTSSNLNIQNSENLELEAKELKATIDKLKINSGSKEIVTEDILDVIDSFLNLYSAHTHIAIGLGTPTFAPNNAGSVPIIKVNLKQTTTSRINVDK